MRGSRPSALPGDTASLRWLLVLSTCFLLLQVAATDYGTGPDTAAAGFWLVVGCVLLWLVWRHRSRGARVVLVVTSLAGAVVYGLGAASSSHAALLMLAYLGQAVPLLLGPVRRHVQSPA